MSKTVLFNDFCIEQGCKNYIEWDLDVCTPDGQQDCIYICKSCMPVGQSYDIESIYFDCPHLTEIVEYKRKHTVINKAEAKRIHQEIMWCKLKPFVRSTMI